MLVNAAYAFEIGNTGLAYRYVNRYWEEGQALGDVLKCVPPTNPATDEIVHHYLVGRIDGVIVACIKLAVFAEGDGTRVCQVGPLAVDPHLQKSGLGKHMIAHAERMIIDGGYNVSHLQIYVVNHRTDLIPYYESRGFTHLEVRDFYYTGYPDLSAIICRPSKFLVMRKPVGAATTVALVIAG